jgi:hypothetical protein
MSRNTIGSPAIAGLIAGIAAALRKIESRSLRIVSLPDLVAGYSVTHPGQFDDKANTGRTCGVKKWAAARAQLARA